MTDELILAIDNGTQSVRALLFDLQGNLVEKTTRVHSGIHLHRTGDVGAGPAGILGYWSVRPASNCGRNRALDKNRIAGVALTTQRSTLINLGEDGQPLRRAITWMDNRRTFGLKPVSGLWGILFALSGMTETVAYLQAEAECNFIRTHEPEIWNKTHKYVFLSGYLTHKLVGRIIDSTGCQVGYVPFDYKKKTMVQQAGLEVAGRAHGPGHSAGSTASRFDPRRDHT